MQVFNFANFQLFSKIFDIRHGFHIVTARAAIDATSLRLSCRIPKEFSPRIFLQSRHCFELRAQADNSVTVHVRSISTPIVYYVCGMHMQGICEIISTNFSKVAICENLTLKDFALYSIQLPVTNYSYYGQSYHFFFFFFFFVQVWRE